MADVQDEDQWLYGDEKDESKEEGEINDKTGEEADKAGQVRIRNKAARGRPYLCSGGDEKDLVLAVRRFPCFLG